MKFQYQIKMRLKEINNMWLYKRTWKSCIFKWYKCGR